MSDSNNLKEIIVNNPVCKKIVADFHQLSKQPGMFQFFALMHQDGVGEPTIKGRIELARVETNILITGFCWCPWDEPLLARVSFYDDGFAAVWGPDRSAAEARLTITLKVKYHPVEEADEQAAEKIYQAIKDLADERFMLGPSGQELRDILAAQTKIASPSGNIT